MNVQEFTSSGSFTVPSGVTEVFVMACAGGAGGCSGETVTYQNAPLAKQGITFLLSSKMVTVIPNTTYTVTIGSGGTGAVAAATFTAGGIGTATSFGGLVWAATAAQSTPYFSAGVNNIIQGGQKRDQSNGVFGSGDNGASSVSYNGGGGTPGTSFAAGVDGGAGNNAGVGSTGSNATSAGGAGANGGCGSGGGGAGGNGFKGYLVVVWSD